MPHWHRLAAGAAEPGAALAQHSLPGDNPAARAASSYLVRLFLDGEDTVLQQKTVGAASGIGFTTPVEVVLDSVALSGTSALLRFDATAHGDHVARARR